MLIPSANVSAYSATLTTNSNVTVNVTPSHGTSIHEESINVVSDCRNGYNLSIATPEGSDLFLYENGTQASTSPTFTAVDGTSSLDSSNNTNKWGYYLPSTVSAPTTNTVFLPLSSTASALKTSSSTASQTNINDTFSIYYGVKVDGTTAPGSYRMNNNGSVVYYLTMDATCYVYNVEFNANGGTGTIDNQEIQTGVTEKLTSAESLTAPQGGSYTDADNNTITGKEDKLWTFWGWNTEVDGTGDWYKDRESVTDLALLDETITFYAQWKQATLADLLPGTQVADEKVIDHDTMQDMSPETCYNSTKFTAIGTPYGQAILKDSRDGVVRTYTVAKLPDGLCWMTQNLNLGTSTAITLTSDDTDLAKNTTFTLPASSPSDFSTSTTQTNYNKATVLDDMTIPDYTVNSTIYSGKIGAYYSYAAATADTATYSKSSAVIVTTSICPKNWDLPTARNYYDLRTKGSIATYNNTNASYIGKNAGNEPYYFIYGGYRQATGDTVNTTSFNSPTTYGYLWTANNNTYRYGYGTYAYSSGLYNSASGSSYYKYYGLGVRCVASQGKVTINYDGNGNDGGSMLAQTNVEINGTNLASNAFTRTHYGFKNWNTEADSSGTTIANSAALSTLNLKPGNTVTLYAQWAPQRQVIYNDNCSSYNNAGCATNADTIGTSSWTNAGSSITLGNETYFSTRTGYLITSWNTARDGSGTSYNPSASYSVPSNLDLPDQVTLYAVWSPALTITFNSNGGTGTMTSQAIAENTSQTLKSNSFTAPSGNYFLGWMTEESRATNTVVYANGATYTTPAVVTPGDSVTLYAKWGPQYTIVYNGNNATGGSMISGGNELKHTYITEGYSMNLYAPNYYKTNYSFVGWSLSPTAIVGGTNPIYGPNETISAPAYDKYGQEINGVKTVILYAIWMEADSNKTMQTFTAADCRNMAQATYDPTTSKTTVSDGSIIALKDQRDNNVYTVARLADGNCWMTENLRLEAENTVGDNQYDSTVTNESLAQGYGGVFTGLDSTEDSNFTYTTNATPNNMYNSTNITGSFPGYRFPRYNNNNTNTSLTANFNGTGSGTYYSWYSYGNYYTWAAAIADTTYYTTMDQSVTNTSICPKGWSLPLGNERNVSGSFYYLSHQVGQDRSKGWRAFPNNFLVSGYFSGSSAKSRNDRGYYWSRTASINNSAAYVLSLSPTGYNSYYTGGDKNDGYSVRCLVDNTYTIQYDGNGATGGSMVSDSTELKHTSLLGDEAIDLYPPNYYKTGYGFVGWSTDSNAWAHFTDNDITNDPTIYGPMETISVPTSLDRIITLYAVWAPAKQDGNNNPVYLQDFDTVSCSSLTSATYDFNTGTITTDKNSIIALTDKRDGNVYTVARLADGNCWMTENLRLEAENTVGDNQYDSTVTDESLAQGYGGVFTGLDSTEDSNFSNTTNATPNNMYNSTNITGSYPGYRFPHYNNTNTDTSLTASYNGTGSGTTYYSWYSYGNYYTWAAAMANTNYYTSSSTSESAGTSLCPTNWILPTSGTTTKDFGVLSQSYGGSGSNQSSTADTTMFKRFRTFPNNFLYSGYFSGSSANNRGTSGNYWSRSAYSNNNAYGLYLYSSRLDPSSLSTKYYGRSVRCLIGS